MNGMLIKNIIEKIKLWFKNLLKKKKEIKKKKQLINQNPYINQKNKLYQNITIMDNGNKNSNIGTIYARLNLKNIYLLNNKGLILKKKIKSLHTKDEELNLQIIDEILESINENNIYINQYVEIDKLFNNISNDQEININTTEKLNIFKENISTIIDKKLDDYEISIIKKAYKEYETVNYVIVTTLIIDDIILEINELNEAFKKNKYTKYEYKQKIDKIREKIDKLETINDRKEVKEELDKLKDDFYTKKKDKYDLLYNEEIFINLNSQCDNLMKLVHIKEENQRKKKILIEKKKELKEKKREEIEKKQQIEKQKEELLREKDNIFKRFIDNEIAHRILLLRESIRKKLTSKEETIYETLKYYQDFLIGEQHNFNFQRNKTKTEVAKLYNDITHTICTMQKKEFIPLEHINIKLEILTTKTLEHQEILNNMIEKKYNVKVEEREESRGVKAKLTTILENEKKKNKTNETPKVLKKELKETKKDNKKEEQKNEKK